MNTHSPDTTPLSYPVAPAITDHLPIAIRAYAAPQFVELKEPGSGKPRRKRSNLKASSRTIIFDTETFDDAAQSLRFGTYQVRDGAELEQAGIFYEPDNVTAAELDALRAHAAANNLELITREAFVADVFYSAGYDRHATIVGFNLPFDISRIAIGHGSARGKMRGGFTLKLSELPWRPNVQIKHISQRSAFIQFAAAGQPQSGASQRRKRPASTRRGHFIDVRTLSGALFARSFSLGGLAEFLGVPHKKIESGGFDRPIDDQMVGYAVRDVLTTWECYAAVVDRFGGFGLRETPANRIYSEAGIGKAYLKDMGIKPWAKMQPNFPRQMLANIMGSYFGGRSEVRIRGERRQVMLCDFLSMYPTVCTLMRLWPFVIAQGMTSQDATQEARELLAGIDLAELRSPDIWRLLTMIVRVKPDADIFPVRACYGEEAQATIGANYLTSDDPLWFTLADCIASTLLTGKVPEVVEAVAFTPGPMQPDLQPIRVSGKADFEVDPARDDFYARVIQLRQATRRRLKGANPAEAAAFDVEQFALKIAANATSYGIFMEVNVEDRDKPFPVTVHSATDKPFSIRTDKHEQPGPYFHPLLATLITGGARLMLAITEKLIDRAGLEWTFCDTDSMAIAKPDFMAISDFYERVHGIVAWFADLNPYGDAQSILKIEDVNLAIGGGEPVPLYCWAVSAKRYALFNLDPDGRPILRKASAHGLGHLLAPYGDADPAPSIPAPRSDLSAIEVERWQHDLWWMIISAAEGGDPVQVDLRYHAALDQPAISRYGATTPDLLRWFWSYNKDRPYNEQVKPFGFLTSLSVDPFAPSGSIASGPATKRRRVKLPKPIAPFNRDPKKAAAKAFDRETGEPVSVPSLKTYRRSLAAYHLHPESKFLNADYEDSGTTRRRHVRVAGVTLIGKEANRWEELMFVGGDRDPAPSYGESPERSDAIIAELRELTKELGRRIVAGALHMSVRQLSAALPKEKLRHPRPGSVVGALRQLAAQQRSTRTAQVHKLREAVRAHGHREAARRLGRDASNLGRELRGASDRHSRS